MAPVWQKLMKNVWTWTNQLHILITYTWDLLNVKAHRMKRILNNIRRCLYHEFLLEQQKNYRCGRNLTQKQQRGLATWKGVVEKCVERYCVLASKNSGAVKTKFQVHAWMIINSNRKNLNQLVNHPDCLTLLAFGTNWETRQSLVCQQTCKNSHKMDSVLRQTIGKIDCIHSSHMISDNIVMWVTRFSIVDWVYFKTQTLLEILRTQNLPREKSYVSSEAEHLSPSVGCARSKHQYPTVLQRLKSFFGCWTTHGWNTCSRSLGRGN